MDHIPEISLTLLLLTFAASFAACFFSSLSGGGAGLILLPVLLFTGLPFINALASHKLAVGFIGIGSTVRYVREGLIDWRVFWWTALVGLPFVVLGTRFAAAVPGEIMEPLVGGVIIAMVLVTLAKKAAPERFDPQRLSPRLLLIGAALL
ncbi:MAG: sulfite exporter TauE/SafE family protein, partial [Thiohalocapsa sp.]